MSDFTVEEMDPRELRPHPQNWRRHPDRQRSALQASLKEFGFVTGPIWNKRTGQLVDGHLRVEEAIAMGRDSIPVNVIDLSASDEKRLLRVFDPITGMAETDQEELDRLIAEIGDPDLEALLAGTEGVSETLEDTGSQAARLTLSERFGVPPFSVLDARQGYWQERKRAWIALGIESELGRGDVPPPGGTGPNSIYRQRGGQRITPGQQGGKTDLWETAGQAQRERYEGRADFGLLGETEQARSHYRVNAAPGGSPRPAATVGKDGKTRRGDGKGKPLARTEGSGAPGDLASKFAGGLASGLVAHRQAQKDGQPSDYQGQEQSGTSIFDPVLCELAYRWFCPDGGRVLDPFAGGSVRGVVAGILGRSYVGVDLRPEQLEANRQQAERIGVTPEWIEGDSRELPGLVEGEFDFVFSCPPYADLEVYSDDPRDLSTLGYAEFLAAYRQIIAASVARLKENRFACFVVGDVRDPKGFYRNFVADTVAAFQDAGMRLYNDAVLVTAVGSLPIRVGKQFGSYRKLGKTHQNVLVFYQGDPKRIGEIAADCEFGELAEDGPIV